ncbi:MAG: hypothetical protein KKD63_02885 [Proteobacteria bacterium]|nr:hypothetical protein [Desulfobulbaceae bacterium]MBU4151805.1 hypothetical protein [Pseudomonadota bacterium]MDP2105841.1 hypothetical protein [Desulfobulbaceae bacterium]
MQINSPKNLNTLYGPNQIGSKPQPEKTERVQTPAPGTKTDSVSISNEALRKQAETKKLETSTTKDIERSRQQQTQTAAPSATTKNLAAQRIDLMA